MIFYDRMGMPLPDTVTWALAFEHDDRVVKQSIHKGRHGEVWISTVWGGFDMALLDEGPPLIFESMVFERRPAGWNDVVAAGRGDEVATVRYPSEDAALRGHAELVRRFG